MSSFSFRISFHQSANISFKKKLFLKNSICWNFFSSSLCRFATMRWLRLILSNSEIQLSINQIFNCYSNGAREGWLWRCTRSLETPDSCDLRRVHLTQGNVKGSLSKSIKQIYSAIFNFEHLICKSMSTIKSNIYGPNITTVGSDGALEQQPCNTWGEFTRHQERGGVPPPCVWFIIEIASSFWKFWNQQLDQS